MKVQPDTISIRMSRQMLQLTWVLGIWKVSLVIRKLYICVCCLWQAGVQLKSCFSYNCMRSMRWNFPPTCSKRKIRGKRSPVFLTLLVASSSAPPKSTKSGEAWKKGNTIFSVNWLRDNGHQNMLTSFLCGLQKRWRMLTDADRRRN